MTDTSLPHGMALERHRTMLKSLERARCPQRLVDLVLGETYQREARIAAEVLQSIREQARVILLLGPTRCGKSAAAAWGQAIMLQPMALTTNGVPTLSPARSGAWLSQWDLGHLGQPGEHTQHLRQARGAYCTVLDDLGLERLTESRRAKLEQLITAHYDDPGCLIITSNLQPIAPPDDPDAPNFRDRYGVRIWKRITEDNHIFQYRGPTWSRADDTQETQSWATTQNPAT